MMLITRVITAQSIITNVNKSLSILYCDGAAISCFAHACSLRISIQCLYKGVNKIVGMS